MKIHMNPEVFADSAICLLATLVITAMVVSYRSNTSQLSDSYPSLMISQSIVQNGTIKLDAYSGRINLKSTVHEVNGHYYGFHPIGPSLIALPFVATAMAAGLDMTLVKDMELMHTILVPGILSACFAAVYFMGRLYVSRAASAVITAVFFLGSSFSSTMMRELWSHDYGLLCSSLILFILARYDTGASRTANPLVLGGLLFLLFVTRPVMAVFIVLVLLYLLTKDLRAAVYAGGFSLWLLVLFIAFSYYEFGQWLHPYYVATTHHYHSKELSEHSKLLAFYGLLLSPSRGVLVFSPFLLVILGGCVALFKRVRGERLFWVCLVWVMVQLMVLSQFARWWAADSYGPRYQSDFLVAFVLLAYILYRAWGRVEPQKSWMPRAVVGSFLIFGALGIWINVWQGLYNPWAMQWNGNINMYTTRAIFDWRYPQFLTSGESRRQRVQQWMGDAYIITIDEERKSLAARPNPDYRRK